MHRSSSSIKNIRERMIRIIDFKLKKLQQQERDANKELVLNESLLQEWSDLIQEMIIFKIKSIKSLEVISHKFEIAHKNTQPPISIHRSELISYQNYNPSKILLEITSNKVLMYDFRKNTLAFEKSQITFNRGSIRKNSTYHFYNESNAIIIGGTKQSNPNLKSKSIFNLNVSQRELTRIGSLEEGLSSHASVLLNQIVYIIGGNRDQNIITKRCYTFNLQSKKTSEIASLNFPCASHCVSPWRNEFIYKVGGIGSCFGQFDLSPYIQRYNIHRNEWQIINPTMPNNSYPFALLAHSFAYVSNDLLIIMGGYNLDMKPSALSFIIKIESKESKPENSQSTHQENHQIVAVGMHPNLREGGFKSSEYITIGKDLIVLQSLMKQTGCLKIGQSIEYL